jgi:glycosyltransferase involved in cell wall biosynthesis
MPTVSVIIPNYNHAAYLRQRIDSVLQQTYQHFEVILMDDCSTDGSQLIISEYANDPRMRIELNETNSGSTFRQWNKGVGIASGQYIWIAESDDYSDPRLLERLVPILEVDQDVAFIYCRSWRCTEGGRTDGFIDPEFADDVRRRWESDYISEGDAECRNYLIYCNTVPNASAVIFRKSVYERVGGSDASLKLCGDWKLWASMALTGKVAYTAEPLNYYRFHDTSVRNRSKGAGVWASEGALVCDWIRARIQFDASFWVPSLLSMRVPLRMKREILRQAWRRDPHPLLNAIGPALSTVRLKFLRLWRRAE